MFDALRGEAEAIAEQLAAMSRPDLCDVLTATSAGRGVFDALEAETLRAVDALADQGPCASATLRSATRVSQREADRRARRAEGLAALPSVKAALASGQISAEHADTLTQAAKLTSASAVEESGLLASAVRRPADMAARDAREWTGHQQCSADRKDEAARQRAARRFNHWRGDDGLLQFYGGLPIVIGNQVAAAIDAEANAMYHAAGGREAIENGDMATLEQRRADAFANLVLGNAAADDQCRTPRHTILVTAEIGLVTGENPEGRAVMIGGGDGPIDIGRAELQRLACSSGFVGTLFGQAGEVLYHGREIRLPSKAQLRELIRRDGGCVICGRAPKHCEAHHIIPWSGPGRGRTDLDNLVLLCAHHHHLLHDTGQVLHRSASGEWSMVPSGQRASARAGPRRGSARAREPA